MAIERRSVTLLEARQARAKYQLAGFRALSIHLLAVLTDARALARAADPGALARGVRAFADHYDAVIDFISEQTRYDAATGQAGTFLGDPSVMRIQRDLRTAVLGGVGGFAAGRDGLRAAGVSETAAGHLAFEASRLGEAAADGIAGLVQSVARRTEGLLAHLTDPADGYVRLREDSISRQAQSYARQIERREAELARMAQHMED
jgi:flagellar hook-associated protein 2